MLSSEEVILIHINHSNHSNTIKILYIGELLTWQDREDLISYLLNNLNVFAWSVEDISGVDKDVITHNLNVRLNFKPRCQPRRFMSVEENSVVDAKVRRLLKVGFILCG